MTPSELLPDYKAVFALKAFLAGLGALVLLWHWLGARLPGRNRSRDVALAVVALVSFTGWWNFGALHFGFGYVHHHEFFHYYLGSKYFSELGYTGLYDCVAVAELEAGRGSEVAQRWTRDLTTNELRRGTPALARPDLCRSRFSSPDRWQQFKRDAGWFHDNVHPQKWAELLADHGYNATPVWTSVGARFSSSAPASLPLLQRLAWIDPVLVAVMVALIWWAFGWRVMAVAMIWWGTNYPGRYTYVGGAFMRQDWLLLSIASLCLAKRGWLGASGFSLTWAALLRLFPAFIALGIVLQAFTHLWRKRDLRLPPDYWRFAMGGALAVLVLVPLSLKLAPGPGGGVDAWRALMQNSRKHASTPLTNNVGLPMLLSFEPRTRSTNLGNLWLDTPWDLWKEARVRVFAERRWLYVVIVAVYLALLGVAVRDQPIWFALVLSLGTIPVFINLTCYYYTIFLGFAALGLRSWLTSANLALLSLVGGLIPAVLSQDDDRHVALSLLMVGYVIGTTGWLALRREMGAETTTSITPNAQVLGHPRAH